MKKKELETLEKINEERKLDKETKQKIHKKVLGNFLIAVVILLLWEGLKLIAINFDKKIATLIFKEISAGIFLMTLFLFEVAYKKDDDNLAITSIEMFLLSIATLLAPYILISKPKIYTSIIDVHFAIYFTAKNFYIFKNQKREYLKEKSDITEIVKKESQDELAQEQLEKIRREQIKNDQEKQKVPQKRGRGRPRKVTTEVDETPKKTTRKTTTSTKTKKTTAKKTATKKTTKTVKTLEPQTEEQPKRKRGRPRKTEI